jgi:hypothetical protein
MFACTVDTKGIISLKGTINMYVCMYVCMYLYGITGAFPSLFDNYSNRPNHS